MTTEAWVGWQMIMFTMTVAMIGSVFYLGFGERPVAPVVRALVWTLVLFVLTERIIGLARDPALRAQDGLLILFVIRMVAHAAAAGDPDVPATGDLGNGPMLARWRRGVDAAMRRERAERHRLSREREARR